MDIRLKRAEANSQDQWEPVYGTGRVNAAAAGAGAVLAAALIIGGLLWYSSRPAPPKPWNSKAIIATFDYLDTEADTRTLDLYYTLENATDFDYRMPKKDQLEINGRLKGENSLTALAGAFSIDQNANFIPARHRRRFTIHMAGPVGINPGPAPHTREEHQKQWKQLAGFISEKMPNLDGFVIFDPTRRYEIDFPNGWDRLK
jgi:hypothetical protein